MSTVLVTGGAGFIGCNLADRLAAEGASVRVYDSLSRPGVEENLAWLLARHRGGAIEPVVADIRDGARLAAAVTGADAVFHLAAQVAVTTSMADPAEDFAVNLGGTFGVLEAVRARAPEAAVVFASTNKVYGDLGDLAFALGAEGYAPCDPALRAHGVSEARKLDFHTPYGCSKGAADQYVLDYARSFGVRACVLRMSCIYGPRQLGTEDQGWVAHFALRALAHETIHLYGDGHQVRDVLHVEDAVAAYVAAWREADRVSGRAFNLGGGPDNALSLRRLVSFLGEVLGRPPAVEYGPWRPGDQRWFVADARAARAALGLPAPLGWASGVRRLVEAFAERREARARPMVVRETVAAEAR